MIKYTQELEETLDKFNLSKNDVCIVGSAVFAQKGLRDNNNLDFIVRPNCLYFFKDQIKAPKGLFRVILRFKNIKLYKNRYFIINIDDNDIFDKELYYKYEDYNVILPEIEFAYKKIKNRDKDKLDIYKIEETNLIYKFIDKNLVDTLITKTTVRKIKCTIDLWLINFDKILFILGKLFMNPKLLHIYIRKFFLKE